MKAFFSINAGLITLAMFSAAQENIPDAAPIADGPLVANPELDTLDMADMLYKQAQAPATKENRQEYGRLLDLSLRKYLNLPNVSPSPPRLLWQSIVLPCVWRSWAGKMRHTACSSD